MSNENRERRLEAVRTHADAVINSVKDICRVNSSPLLADKIDITTNRPSERPSECKEGLSIVSNFAHQQNFMRILVGLTNLTGNKEYADLARANFKYHFDNLMLENGLFRWGGHHYLDLLTLENIGEKGLVHELKNDFPFYELMYEVNPEKAEVFVKSFWNAHVYEWKEFEIGRHSKENNRGISGIWDREFGDPAPFTPREGLSFMNIGNDLMYSAAKLYKCNGDAGAVKWGENLYHMYVKCRNPQTGLGAYQFTQPLQQCTTTDTDNTLSKYGDRAKRQFGPELGDNCLEGNMLFAGQADSIYVINPQVICEYADAGTYNADRMLEWARQGLSAFVKYCYIEETNMFRPMLADGQDLTGFVFPRNGYYGPAGKTITRYEAAPRFLVSLIPVAARTGDEYIWSVARKIAQAGGLGDIGSTIAKCGELKFETSCNSEGALMAFVRLYHLCGNENYLRMAEKIGDNIEDTMFTNGYCIAPGQKICDINTSVPLALLELEAALAGNPLAVPTTIYRKN